MISDTMRVHRGAFCKEDTVFSKKTGYVWQKNVQNVYAHVSILLLFFESGMDFLNDAYRIPHASLETDIEYFYVCDS